MAKWSKSPKVGDKVRKLEKQLSLMCCCSTQIKKQNLMRSSGSFSTMKIAALILVAVVGATMFVASQCNIAASSTTANVYPKGLSLSAVKQKQTALV